MKKTLVNILKNIIKKIEQTSSVDTYYPVGSIYISVDASFNPNTSFGGTWIKLTNRFLVGAGDTYELGAEGGSTSYTPQGTNTGTSLSTAQLPAHTHGSKTLTGYMEMYGDTGVVAGAGAVSGMVSKTKTFSSYKPAYSSGGTSYGVTITATHEHTSVGSGNTHTHTFNGTAATIIPPYKAVYMWQRTA